MTKVFIEAICNSPQVSCVVVLSRDATLEEEYDIVDVGAVLRREEENVGEEFLSGGRSTVERGGGGGRWVDYNIID